MPRLIAQTVLCLLSFPALACAVQAQPECVGERVVDPAVPHRNAAEVQPGVRLANGSVVYAQTDLSTAGRVIGLEMTRVYRSDMQFDGPMGRGWTGELFQAAWKDETTGDIQWHDAEGFLHTFILRNGTWRAPPGVYTVATFENNAVRLRNADGTRLEFNDCGQFIARVDRHGNSLTLQYDTEHLLSSVTDDRGFTWEFVYDTNGRIIQLVDRVWETGTRAPRTVDYEYDASGNLLQVKLPETSRYNSVNSNRVTWAYEYDAAGRLTGVYAPNEVANNGLACTQYDYDASGRVVSFRDGHEFATHQLRYTLDASGNSLVRHVDPLGARVDYTLDNQGRTVEAAEFTGFWAVSLTTPLDHDIVLQTQAKLRSSDPDKFTTKYEYNWGQQLTRIDHPAGNSEEFTYPNPTKLAQGKATTVVGSVITLDGADWLPGEFAGGYLRLGSGLADYAYYEVASNTEDSLTVVAVSLSAEGWLANAKFVVFTENPDKLASGNLLEHRWLAKDAALADITQTFTYEPYFQQLRKATSARGYTTQYEYEFDTTGNPEDGNLVVVRSPQVEVLLPDGTTSNATYETRYGYNSYGQLVSTTDAEGTVETRHYFATGDQIGFLESVIVDDGNLDLTEVFGYDKIGVLTHQYSPAAFEPGVTPDDFLTTWAVNELGQRWSETGLIVAGGQRVEEFRYFDPNGNEVRTWRNYVTDDGLAPPAPIDAHDPDSFSKSANPMSATWVETLRAFNLANRLTSETTDAIAGSPVETTCWSYEYDERLRQSAKLSPLLNRTEWVYDERGLEYGRIEGAGSTVEGTFETDYNANGDIAATRTPLGHETLRTHDAHGREVRVQDAGGHAIEYQLNAEGNRTQERRVDSLATTLAETTWDYDALDRRVRESRLALDASGTAIGTGTAETFFTLDGRGHVVARTTALGHSWTFAFDAAGRQVLEVDPVGNSVARVLDATGNPTQINYVDQNLLTQAQELSSWEADYNALGLAVRVRDRRNQPGFDTEVSYQYDGWGRLTAVTDASDAVTRYTYDLRSRLTSKRRTDDASGILASTVNGWDRDDRPTHFSVWSEPTGTVNLQLTTTEYDARNRATRVEHPDLSARTNSYDNDSNCVLTVDETGTQVQQVFEARGLLASRLITPAGGTVGNTVEEFEYDGLGQLTATESLKGTELVSQNVWEWNTLGRRESHTVTIGDGAGGELGSWTTQSSYDEFGNSLSLTQSDGNGLQYQRDELSRAVGFSDLLSEDEILNQEWAGPDRVVRQVSGNGLVSNFSYEAGYTGLLSRIEVQREPELLFGIDYRYDTRGLKRRERRDHDGGTGRDLQHDAVGRLEQAQIGVDVSGALLDDPTALLDYGMQRAFGYVMPSNRDMVHDSVSTNTVVAESYGVSTDGMNRYLSVGGFAVGYDVASRVIHDGSAGVNFAYDYASRRVLADDDADLLSPSGRTHYDALGRRVFEETLNDGVLISRTVIVYGPEGEVSEEIVLDATGSETNRVQYLRDGDSILAQRVDGDWQFRHLNAEGSLIGLTDDAGKRVAIFDYLPLGTVMRIGVLQDVAPGEILNVELDTPAVGTIRIHLSQVIVANVTGCELAVVVSGDSYLTTQVVSQFGATLDVADADGSIFDAVDNLGAGFLLLETTVTSGALSWSYDALTNSTTITDSNAGFSSGLRGGVFIPDTSLPGWFDIIEVDPMMSWLRVRGDLTNVLSGTADFRAVEPTAGAFNERHLYRGFRHDIHAGDSLAFNRAGTHSSNGRGYDPRTGRCLTPVANLENPYAFRMPN